ncbi:MAG: 2-hydroxyacyl-CoA dehydratase [Gemmatimonadota bacterium]
MMDRAQGWVDPARPVLEQLDVLSERTFADPDLQALADYRKRGRDCRVIGCFPVYTPEELVHAAGFLPAHLYGGGQIIEIERADARIQSFVCSIAKSTLELGLAGRIPMVDGFLFPSICDVARNLSGIWKRNFPNQFIGYCHWPEQANAPSARVYLRSELARVLSGLEELRGREVGVDELNASLAVYNENRRLMRALRGLRRAHPEKLALAESYRLFRAGGFMPREEHNELLRRALEEAEARERKPRDAIRVVLEGSFCEQMPVAMIEMIEEAGCYVVDDDLLLGLRWYSEDVPADTEDPLDALAGAFLAGAPDCAVHYVGRESRVAAFGEKLTRSGAEGVIFASAKFCEPALYDVVLLRDEAERHGLPYVLFEFEEKAGLFDAIQTQVETFVESILFFEEEGARGPSPLRGAYV